MKCPHCHQEINIGSLLGAIKSPRRAAASRRNAKLGGWVKGRKRGPRPPRDPNQAAKAVVDRFTRQDALDNPNHPRDGSGAD